MPAGVCVRAGMCGHTIARNHIRADICAHILLGSQIPFDLTIIIGQILLSKIVKMDVDLKPELTSNPSNRENSQRCRPYHVSSNYCCENLENRAR